MRSKLSINDIPKGFCSFLIDSLKFVDLLKILGQ